MSWFSYIALVDLHFISSSVFFISLQIIAWEYRNTRNYGANPDASSGLFWTKQDQHCIREMSKSRFLSCSVMILGTKCKNMGCGLTFKKSGFFVNFTGHSIQFVKNEVGYSWEMRKWVIYEIYGVLFKKSEFSGKEKYGIIPPILHEIYESRTISVGNIWFYLLIVIDSNTLRSIVVFYYLYCKILSNLTVFTP